MQTPLPVLTSSTSLLLVVAHYDDEVIGVGAHLTRWAPQATLVHVTNSAPADGHDARTAGFATPDAYGLARCRELDAALSWLPQPLRSRTTLDIPDRAVTDRLPQLVASLAELVDRLGPSALVTHAYEGGHPDHDAIAFAAHALRRLRGGPFDLLEFAAYHEAEDGRLITNRFADEPSSTIPLTSEQRRLKRLMLAQFATQARVLAPFGCDCESVRRARPVDFAAPPPGGRIWYDRLGWEITGERWRAAVAETGRAMALEGLTC